MGMFHRNNLMAKGTKKKPQSKGAALKAQAAAKREPLLQSALEGAKILGDRARAALPKELEKAHAWMRGKR